MTVGQIERAVARRNHRFAGSIPVSDSEFFLSVRLEEYFYFNFITKLQTSIKNTDDFFNREP